MTQEANNQIVNREGSPQDLLRQAAEDFSRRLQEVASSFSLTVRTIASDIGDALNLFAEEQRRSLDRQEELHRETSGLTDLARTYTREALDAAADSKLSQLRATELIGELEGRRQVLDVLIGDLRSRISALTVLVAPLPAAALEPSQVRNEAVAAPPSQPQGRGNVPRSQEIREAAPSGGQVPSAGRWGPGWIKPLLASWGPGGTISAGRSGSLEVAATRHHLEDGDSVWRPTRSRLYLMRRSLNSSTLWRD